MDERRDMNMLSEKRRATQPVLLLMFLGLVACTSETPPAETAAPAGNGPRVFFAEPQDGATVTSPVMLRFGVSGIEISPVPVGEVLTTRPGLGHHHVGVDIDCLPPGTEIPKAAPWVHFGDGKSEISMQLPSGTHKLTLQFGDDKHVTMPGLCSTITVNVAP
jgi:hypothetical protein